MEEEKRLELLGSWSQLILALAYYEYGVLKSVQWSPVESSSVPGLHK